MTPPARASTTGTAMTEEVDLFVIGAGSGGVRAARISSGYGARVMIAEEYRVGGTCVIRGCVPKKLLVYASRFAEEFEDAAGYGWSVPEPSFDWATLIANKDREIARLEAAYTANLDRAKVQDRQEPGDPARSPHGQARRHRRDRARQAHPDRDRRPRRTWAPISWGWSTSSPPTRRFTCASFPEACRDPGRRIHRVGIRHHLQRSRRRSDGGLSRRKYPARFRRRGAQSSAHRIGEARHQDPLQAVGRGRREGRARARCRTVRPRADHGRCGDVRNRPPSQHPRHRPRNRRRADGTAR